MKKEIGLLNYFLNKSESWLRIGVKELLVCGLMENNICDAIHCTGSPLVTDVQRADVS